MISTHIRTEGLYVKTTIIYQLKRLCIPDCAYRENMFINSIHISLYHISLTQNILYQIKRDVAIWKRLRCPQRNQRTWWQIVATPYTGLAYFIVILPLALWWQQQNINQTSNSQQTPHTSAPHCIWINTTMHQPHIPQCTILSSRSIPICIWLYQGGSKSVMQ